MTDLERELLTALKACFPFVAYTAAYERDKLTANEVKRIDTAIRLTNFAFKSADIVIAR